MSEGDAQLICNAGGRASDGAIRSLVISGELLGTGPGPDEAVYENGLILADRN